MPFWMYFLSSALALRWKDFEDAVQFLAAKENGITHIITRNKADYETQDISCVSPAEFIENTVNSGDTGACALNSLLNSAYVNNTQEANSGH